MESMRLRWIDSLKGFLIFLVVFGHVVTNGISASIISDKSIVFANEFVYTFHMPAFFFLSGLFVHNYFKTMDSCIGAFKKCAIRIICLLIPYMFFSILYWLCKIIFATTGAVNNEVNVIDITLIFIRPIGEYWFLYSLMLFNICFFIFSFIFCKLKNSALTIILVLLGISMFILSTFTNETTWFTGLTRSLPYFIFFSLGYAFSPIILGDQKCIIKIIFCICFLALGLSLFLINKYYFSSNSYVSLGASILLIFGLTFASKLLPLKSLSIVGQQSMSIYLIHPFVIVVLRIILSKLITNEWVYVIIVSSLVCILCFTAYYFVIKKLFFIDCFIYPNNYFFGSLKTY